jgi:hypothetical protein
MPDAALTQGKPKTRLGTIVVKNQLRLRDACSTLRMNQKSSFNMLERAVSAESEQIALLVVIRHGL